MTKQPRRRVLVVDDDTYVSKGLCELLEGYCYYVRAAHSLYDAMHEIVMDRFDVVVLDWILPDGEAKRLVSFLQEYAPWTSIVVYSAFATADAEFEQRGEFVKKSHDLEEIRHAIRRGMNKSAERWEQINRDTDDIDSDHWFVDGVIDLLPNPSRFEGHIGVSAPDDWFADQLAYRVTTRFMTQWPCVSFLDGLEEQCEQRMREKLFGHCVVPRTGTPTLAAGLFDQSTVGTVIVRHADRLPMECQRILASTILEQRFSRVGSDRELELDVRLVLTTTAESEELPKASLTDELAAMVGDRWLHVSDPTSIPGGLSRVVEHLLCSDASRPRSMGKAAMFLLSRFAGHSKWPVLKCALEQCNESANSRVLEVEDLGIPFIETLIATQSPDGASITPWDEIEVASKAVYLCRVLSETNGNIAEAARVSGLGRKAIYSALSKAKIDHSVFKRPKSSQNHQRQLPLQP